VVSQLTLVSCWEKTIGRTVWSPTTACAPAHSGHELRRSSAGTAAGVGGPSAARGG